MPAAQKASGVGLEDNVVVYKKSMERLKLAVTLWQVPERELREVKAEIDRYNAAQEENKETRRMFSELGMAQERLQKDFEAWYGSLQARAWRRVTQR